jgi:hypothetical protein
MTCNLPIMPLSLGAAFLAGAASSVHCLAMCGGVSSALALRARRLGPSRSAAAQHVALNQAGRLIGYTLIGTACGAVGAGLSTVAEAVRLGSVMRIAAAGLLVGLAVQLIFGWRTMVGLERRGALLWRYLKPLIPRIPDQRLGSVLLGALWGFMPCGLVYSMLTLSLLSGSAWAGAGLMLMFGMGTLPAVLGGGLLASYAAGGRGMAIGVRRCAGVLLLTLGCWALWSAALTGAG